MEAKYFYNEVMNDNHKNEGYDGWYCNGFITIHKIGSSDKDTRYTLHRDGMIIGSDHKRDYLISDLVGDYEPYSEVQFLKCGYLLFNTSTIKEIKQIISDLHNRFNDEYYDYDIHQDDKHFLCGGSSWHNGLTENFSYYAPNGIQVSLYTIPELCSKNSRRSKFGKRCLPFDKTYIKENSIYVSFVSTISNPDLDNRADEALKDLINNLDSCKWINMKMLRYIYS